MFDADTLLQRRQRVANALGADCPIVLIGAGQPIPKPGGLDQTYRFRPHPEYYWLTGSDRWGGVLVFDPREGWIHFVRAVDEAERLWEADCESPEGRDVRQFEDWLQARGGGPVAVIAAEVPAAQGDDELSAQIKLEFDAVRRAKDACEVDILSRAFRATAAGFARAREVIRPGVSERAIQIEMEAEMFRQGADQVGYDTIVAAGSHAAVLHSAPSQRTVAPDDVVLIDAGGEVSGYTSDVTRTFPAGDRFTAEQQAIYDIVLAAEQAAIGKCRVGVEWHDVHRTAAAELAAGLRHVGILRTGVEESLDGEAVALFFPHGVGHMVGLGVRDVGGRAAGREEGRLCCGAKVRVDLPVQQGFLMTVEPGIYFVPALLDDLERRQRFRDAVAWEALDRWRAVGGIRIEDNVLVTSSEPEVITAGIAK